MKCPLIVLALMFLLVGCAVHKANAHGIDKVLILKSQLKNVKIPTDNVIAGGQPTREQLAVMAKAGIKHVINLRPPQEQDWDEGAYVTELGMKYHNLPVAGPAGVTSENAKKLDQLLQRLSGEPVLLHCSSSNRVGGLVAIAEADVRNADTDAAILKGQQYGLTRLEGLVRKQLNKE